LSERVAQNYPGSRFVSSWRSPPGATDTFSRVSAAEISKSIGQQVIVENRPGGGTTIAADLVAKSAPDGYTLLFTDLSTHAITPSIYMKLPYHPLRDFAAVAPVSSSPLIMVAHPSVGVRSAKELIALTKRHPGITCGNAGMGTVTHMASEKFRMRAGIDLTLVATRAGHVNGLSPHGGDRAHRHHYPGGARYCVSPAGRDRLDRGETLGPAAQIPRSARP
jgi:tripartite-type tricarboxylate transporter receptor subunit TctC